MTKIETLDYTVLDKWLAEPTSIVITAHKSPDGDAIGSALGWYHLLRKKGHQVRVIVPDAFPGFLSWMDGADDILRFDIHAEESKQLISDSALIFCLDYNRLERVGDMGAGIAEADAKKILVDHHIDPDEGFDQVLSDTAASSTSELVYRMMDALGWNDLLDKAIAEALYAGIMTDTGSFKFSSTSASTHRIAADLMDAGLVPEKVHHLIFDTNSFQRLQLLGYALSKKLKFDTEKGVSIISLSLGEKNRFHYRKGDTEGLVNYGLSIQGANMAVFLSEELEITKFSFRSKGDLSVNDIARAHFNGGGHKNAAGGKLDMKLKDALNYLEDVLENKLDL